MHKRHPARRLLGIFTVFVVSLFFCASARAADNPPAPAAPAEAPASPAATEKPTARREETEPETLTDAKTALKAVRAERDEAEKKLAAAQGTVLTLTADLDKARASFGDSQKKLTDAETKATAAEGKFTGLCADVKAALKLTDEQVTNLVSDKTVLVTAAAALANARAVEIAASQGVPPVPTKPGAAAAEDIKEVFAAAAAEPDPRKRGALFAAASARLAAKAKTHGDN